MNTDQLETVLNTTEAVPAVVAADAVPAASQEATASKRTYTKKEDMQRGNDAIIATLPTTLEGAFSKAQILAALSAEDRALVEHNWNLRISLLEETEQVLTNGRQKVAKRYFRAG